MIFKNSKFLLILYASVAILLSAVLVIGIYRIRAENLKTSEFLSNANESEKSNALIHSIRVAQKNASEDLTKFDSFILSSDKLVPFIENIEEIGSILGIDVKIVSVSKEDENKSQDSNLVQITMNTEGTWAESTAFLKAIENLPQRIRIKEASIAKEESNWSSKIVMLLYLFD